MGFARDEVALALTIARALGHPDDPETVAAACRKFRSLAEIGFPRELIAGALIACEGDMERASDACLACGG